MEATVPHKTPGSIIRTGVPSRVQPTGGRPTDFDNLAVETGMEGLAIERSCADEMAHDIEELDAALHYKGPSAAQLVADVKARLLARLTRLEKLDPELQSDVSALDFEADERRKLRSAR